VSNFFTHQNLLRELPRMAKGHFLMLNNASRFFVCPPEGGLGSSWLKHALKQRPPTTLIGMARAVVVLVLAFVVTVFHRVHFHGPRSILAGQSEPSNVNNNARF
jgi:hypothetical protein